MTGEQPQATLFERGSKVLEYWLANAEGFHVVSGRKPRDRVDHVVVDRQLGSATTLIVRRKRGRRPRRIPVLEVSAVDPFERLLYLTPKRPVRTATGRGAAWAAPRIAASVRTTQRRSVDAARWLHPRVAASAHSTRRRSTEVVRRLQPHLVAAARRSDRVARVAAVRAELLLVRAGRELRPLLAAAVRTARAATIAVRGLAADAAAAVRSARSS